MNNKLIDCVLDNYLTQMVTESTRYRIGQQDSLLDLLFVKDENLIMNLEMKAPLGKSDHVMMVIDINTTDSSTEVPVSLNC